MAAPSVAKADVPVSGEQSQAKVQLCTVHGNNLVPKSCRAYKACSHMVRQNMVDQLVVDAAPPTTVPTAAVWLMRSRSDKVEPTLTFTP